MSTVAQGKLPPATSFYGLLAVAGQGQGEGVCMCLESALHCLTPVHHDQHQSRSPFLRVHGGTYSTLGLAEASASPLAVAVGLFHITHGV